MASVSEKKSTPDSLGDGPTALVPQRWSVVAARLASKYGTIFALAVIIAVFALIAPSAFFSGGNFEDILNDNSVVAIIACGLTIPMVAGEFDLSIGYVGSYAGVLVTGFLVTDHMPIVLAIVATIGACACIGLVNGVLVTVVGVSSFIATLATGTIVVGLNYSYNSGIPVSLGVPQGFLDINLTTVGTVPLPVIIAAVIVFLLWVILNHTIFGYYAQASGQNREAARLSGVSVNRVRLLSLVISSCCAGAGGVLLAAKLGSGQTTAADGYLLTAFAAAFLGSVALRDSEFHIVGTVIGVMTIGIAFNGLAIMSAPAFWQYVLQGGLLVAAVAISTVGRRLLAGR